MNARNVKVLTIVCCTALVFSLINFIDRRITSGFMFRRYGLLRYNVPDGNIIDGFETFPFEGTLLGVLVQVLDTPVTDVLYIPLIILVAIPFIYVGVRIGTGDKLPLLIGGSLIIYMFASEPHYKEYYISMPLFSLFAYTAYRWLLSSDYRIDVLVIILFTTLHLYGPPISMWAVVFLITLVTCITILRYDFSMTKRMAVTPILSTVIYFWFNNKIYDHFMEIERLIVVFSNISELFQSGEVEEVPYSYSSESPDIVFIMNVIWYVLATLPVIIGFIWTTYQRGASPKSRDIKELFIIFIMVGGGAQMVLYYFISGSVGLRTVRIIAPIATAYYVYEYLSKDHIRVFGIIFISVAIISSGATIGYGLATPATNADSISAQHNHINNHMNDDFVSDHYNYGQVLAEAGENDIYPDEYSREVYDPDIMAMVIEMNPPPDYMPSYLIVNVDNLDRPIESGDSWAMYRPIAEDHDNLQNHNKVESIYSNSDHNVYFIDSNYE